MNMTENQHASNGRNGAHPGNGRGIHPGNGSGARQAPDRGPLPAGLPEAGASSFAARDLIPRRRDRFGNRFLWRWVMGVPVAEDRPLADTPLAGVLGGLAAHQPLRAHFLHHFYDQRLRESVRRLAAVRAEEEERLAGERTRVAATHEAAQRRLAVLRREREAVDDPGGDRARRMASLAADLSAAQASAAEKAARAGGHFDPAADDDAAVVRLSPPTLERLAAQEGLPWVQGDAGALLPAWLSWGTTVLVGIMIGLSLGIMGGLLPVDAITRHGAMAGLCALIGFAAAALGKQAVTLAHRQASERASRGLAWPARATFVLLALALDAAVVLIDSVVEREGLLANMRLRDMTAALSGGSPGDGAQAGLYFCAAVLVNLGYIVSSAWEGYFKGRHHFVRCRLLALQQAAAEAAEAERRGRPEVQAALTAAAGARRAEAALKALEALPVALDAEIARLESAGPPEPGLPTEALRRIQDAWDDVCGCQLTFDGLLEGALADHARRGRWWRRLGRATVARVERRLSGQARDGEEAHQWTSRLPLS